MMKTLLFYIRLNLLWLFRYRCNIPADVWFTGEFMAGSSPVYIANKRLHIYKIASAKTKPLPDGIAYNDLSNGQ